MARYVAVKTTAVLRKGGGMDFQTKRLGEVEADCWANAMRAAFDRFGRGYSGLAVVADKRPF